MRFPALLCLLICASLSAQQPAQKPAPPPASTDPFAAESFIVDRDDAVFSFNPDGTGFRERTAAVKVQSDAALHQFGVVSMPFASATEHVEFRYVRVRHADGTVTETPPSEALEQAAEVTREAPFYSDQKSSQIPVKNLRIGDTVEWQVRVTRTKAEAPNEFWGSYSLTDPHAAVVREQSLELRLPPGKHVQLWTNPAFLALPGNGPQAVETVPADQRGQRIVRWQSFNLKPTTGKEAELFKEDEKHHVLTDEEQLDATQGKLPTIAWTTFPSWEAVGAWYRGLQGDRTAPSADIKARVAEITAGKSTEDEKVSAVYAYVSTQIRYIGVAFGIGRYQPHHADDVLSNQYGDCKDKETLLAAMLAVLGVRTDAVLIGAGVRFNAVLPSPEAFNHLIALAHIDGKPVWMDSTEEVAPAGMMLAPLRDKQALVIPETGAAAIERTPKEPPFASFQHWDATGTLDKTGTSESHITVSERGDIELFLRAVLRQVSPAQYNEFLQKLLGSLGYAGTGSHAEFSRADDLSAPLTFSFDYHREHSGDWDNLRIVPQLAPVSLPTVDEKDPPLQDLDLSAPRTEHSTSILKLPEGWRAELPEAVHQKSPWVTYDLTYRFADGTLTTERTLVILQQKVPVSDLAAYKKWQNAVNPGSETFIQLVRRAVDTTPPGKPGKKSKDSASKATDTAATSEAAAPGSAESAARLQALFAQVEQAYKDHDIKAMTADLDQVKAIDPKARRILAWEAAVASLQNHWDEAIADNRKELELYPDEMDRYVAIVWVQGRKNDKHGAEATLRTWSAADPDNPTPPLQLASLLLADNQPADAVTAAQEAVSRTPEGKPNADQARLVLGQAQIAAGKPQEGAATLTALLKNTEDPLALNNAAYELSKESVDLPLAETSERKALDMLSAETESWTLDESPATLAQKTSLLVAAWDTMGWILFREGKLAEAEAYVGAAWLNNQHPEVRGHLKDIQAARAAAYQSAPAEAHVDPNKSSQSLRTLPLGSANGRKGTAEFRLLLSQGKVEKVEKIELPANSPLPGGEDLIKPLQLPNYFPPGSKAKLARTAYLDCHGSTCELVFEP